MSAPDNSAPEKYERPPLRYKRFGGGYRREDVEFALAELRLTLRQLDNDLETLRDRNRELESELHSARNELETFRGREHELSQTMAEALRRAAEIAESANTRAREIVARAEEAAMRIQSEASRRIEYSGAQFNELLRLKDNLVDAMRAVVGDFDQAISRVERGDQLFADLPQATPVEGRPAAAAPEPATAPPAPAAPPPTAAAPPPPAPTPPAPERQPVAAEHAPSPAAPPQPAPPAALSIPAVPTPPPVQPPPPPPPAPEQQPVAAEPAPPPAATAPPTPAETPPAEPPAEATEGEATVFDTRVELDAGPFSDFAALSAFERSLAHLPKVEDVYVRRLADDRAMIELTLAETAPLLDTMRASLPYELDVRSSSRTKIVVNVAVKASAGAR